MKRSWLVVVVVLVFGLMIGLTYLGGQDDGSKSDSYKVRISVKHVNGSGASLNDSPNLQNEYVETALEEAHKAYLNNTYEFNDYLYERWYGNESDVKFLEERAGIYRGVRFRNESYSIFIIPYD